MENKLSMTALPPEKLVEVLTRSGYREMTMEKLERDINAGLPLNEDGTINFLEYIAWMVREVNTYGNDAEHA